MTEQIGPISPAEARNLKIHAIPKEVFQVVNEFLATRIYEYHSIIIKQGEVEVAVLKLMNGDKTVEDPGYVRDETLYKNHWLDIEDVYRQAGWTVRYDKPGYCENYPAFWEFTPK